MARVRFLFIRLPVITPKIKSTDTFSVVCISQSWISCRLFHGHSDILFHQFVPLCAGEKASRAYTLGTRVRSRTKSQIRNNQTSEHMTWFRFRQCDLNRRAFDQSSILRQMTCGHPSSMESPKNCSPIPHWCRTELLIRNYSTDAYFIQCIKLQLISLWPTPCQSNFDWITVASRIMKLSKDYGMLLLRAPIDAIVVYDSANDIKSPIGDKTYDIDRISAMLR